MNVKQALINFGIYFVLIFAVSAVVTFLYSLIFHGTGKVAWETSFQLAIILGIVLTLKDVLEKAKNK